MFDKNSLDFEIVAAAKCTKATYPGDKARELLRLARLGLWAEQHAKPALEELVGIEEAFIREGGVDERKVKLTSKTCLAAYPAATKASEPMIEDADGCQ